MAAIALVCLCSGSVIWMVDGQGIGRFSGGVLVRVGTVFASLWLAWPALMWRRKQSSQPATISPWEWGSLVLLLAMVVPGKLPMRWVIPGVFVCLFFYVLGKSRR